MGDVLELTANRANVRRVVPEDAGAVELELRLSSHRLEPEEGLEESGLGHARPDGRSRQRQRPARG